MRSFGNLSDVKTASILLIGCLAVSAWAQDGTKPTIPPTPASTVLVPDDQGWVQTKHSVTIHGKNYNYTATVGMMPIRNDAAEIQALMFFTAYRLEDGTPTRQRPITFAFNGGPGSASIYLHMGALGPKRINLMPTGSLPPPPYSFVDNEESILPESDLVMIDPIGTGYSRAEKPELAKQYYSVKGDIDSVGQFIQRYLTDEDRLLSPVFVLGESYGGVRAPGLAGYLTDAGIGLNGLVLVSPLLDTNILWGEQSDSFFLPTYAAVAWYHHRLSPEMQSKTVEQVFNNAQQWMYDEYLPAILRGSATQGEERKRIASKVAALTGLSEQFVDNSNLQVDPGQFFKELLRDQRYTIGRFDARFLGVDQNWSSSYPEYDPSDSQVSGPIATVVTAYLRGELGYKTNVPFAQDSGDVNGAWQWDQFGTERLSSLRSAMYRNPYMKVLVDMGYFDLAVPVTTVQQSLNQMALDPRLAENITKAYYPAGHMMYVDQACRVKFHDVLAKFIAMASKPTLPAKIKLQGGG